MVPTIKVALVGTMRSGKDTVADILWELYPDDIQEYRFSSGITEIIEQYFPVLEGKPREHYQLIGQTFRQLDPDVWINRLHSQRQLATVRNCAEIITDVRQANEVAYCKQQGFTVIKVVADDTVRLQRIQESGDIFRPEQFYHETELAVDIVEADYTIENNGTLDELWDKVKAVYDRIIKEETAC